MTCSADQRDFGSCTTSSSILRTRCAPPAYGGVPLNCIFGFSRSSFPQDQTTSISRTLLHRLGVHFIDGSSLKASPLRPHLPRPAPAVYLLISMPPYTRTQTGRTVDRTLAAPRSCRRKAVLLMLVVLLHARALHLAAGCADTEPVRAGHDRLRVALRAVPLAHLPATYVPEHPLCRLSAHVRPRRCSAAP